MRTVIAADSVISLLTQQKAIQEEKARIAGPEWNNEWNLVFTNDFGGHLVHLTVHRKLKEIMNQAGFPAYRFHDLRHGYATASLQNGDDIKTVQTNLGHATAAFTLDVYNDVTERMKERSAENMERFIQSITNNYSSK